MISITPQGEVYLCKTPLENDYKNQLTFSNATAQQTYFNGKVFRSSTDYTYIKKDSTITVSYPIDEILECNYLYYKNVGFSNKWYYCFITNMEYVNENATRLFIETDVFQTYQFNIVKKQCFVEREHVNDDTIGAHTVHEGLNTGDMIIRSTADYRLGSVGNGMYIVIGLSNLVEGFPTPSDNEYNGIYSGLTYYILETPTKATAFIKALMEAWEYDASKSIYSLFIVPRALFTGVTISWQTGTIGSNTLEFGLIPSSSSAKDLNTNFAININTDIDGYTPKNNKLFTGEFNYLYATNNCGSNMIYKYEDFVGNTPRFKIQGSLCIGCSIRMDPLNYKVGDPDYLIENRTIKDYGLVCGKFPTCSWNCDSYTNWLTTNAVNIVSDIIGKTAMSIGGFATGNIITGTTAGLDAITTAVTYGSDKDTMVNTAEGNTNSGDIMASSNNLGFYFYKMCMRKEYAEICDKYLSMFGYKVNTVKIPNFTGRTNWNYIKTIDCNFEGDIPQMYLNKIKEMFNSGVTLWHNPNTMLDYSQNNTIVS